MRLIDAYAVETAYIKSFFKNDHKTTLAKAVHDQEHNHILQILKKQPTINPFQWVPVEDHLPKKDGKYLVAIKNGNGFSVSTRKFKTQTSHWTIGHWERRTAGVRFWAELPEPPKGD